MNPSTQKSAGALLIRCILDPNIELPAHPMRVLLMEPEHQTIFITSFRHTRTIAKTSKSITIPVPPSTTSTSSTIPTRTPQAKCEQGTEKEEGVVVVLEDEDNHKSVDDDER